MSPPEQDDLIEQLARDLQRRGSRPREPRRIGSIIQTLMARKGYAQQQSGEQYEQVWRQAAGSALAARSRPGNLRRGVLEVIVADSVTLQELSFQKQHLLHSLIAALPEKNINDLRLKIGSIQ